MPNQRLPLLAALLLPCSMILAGDLKEEFREPPQEYGIRCWWWWLNGNVTREAITRDLEEMKAKGFSGACIFDAGGAEQRSNAQVPAGPMYGTPEWRLLFKHAVETAHRLGLVLSLNIQSGWNLGGPDVTPEEATKCLTWSEISVAGGSSRFSLPQPKSRDGFYRDIAVLAFPEKQSNTTPRANWHSSSSQPAHPVEHATDGKSSTFWVSGSDVPGSGPTPSKPQWIAVSFEKPIELAGVRLIGRPAYGPRDCEVQVSENGEEFRVVHSFSAGPNETVNARFSAAKTRHVRLAITAAYDPVYPARPRNVQIAELAFLDPQGAMVGGGTARRPIRNLAEKAVFHELGGSAPDTRFLLTDEPDQPGEADTRVSDIVDLSSKLRPDGALAWVAPEGRWTIMRFGYTCTGARVSTSSGNWQGRVIDHMSERHFRAYWARHVAPVLQEVRPLLGKTLTHLQTDSWELGGINWSDDFTNDFKRFRGYEPRPYLPIIAGKIIENRDLGTRFLADLRKTIGDCVSENHYGTFAKMAREHGMAIQPESAGPHAGPFDGLKNYSHSDIMMSEFWVPSPHRPRPENRFFVKQAASASHIFNRRLVGAESFTSIGPHWNDTIWSSQRPSFDHELCSGLNLVLLHTFTCSPAEMGLPGQEYFAGTHFNPQVTWWDMSDGFITYMRRCQLLTQNGRFVADAAYYYGDHVPNVARSKQDDPPRALPGFDYDLINEDVLLASLSVQNGRLVLPHGMSYRVLVLPDHKVLSLAAMRKVSKLVRDGATVIGSKPERTASLVEFPSSEQELKQLADELFGAHPAPEGERKTGKGSVVWGRTAREVLLTAGARPDFEPQGAATNAFDYIHYTLAGQDCYFVCNQIGDPQDLDAVFRAPNGYPELWDPVTGSIRPAPDFTRSGGQTTVPLRFDPYGSVFVMFSNRNEPAGQATHNYSKRTPVQTLEGSWELRFDSGRGAPERIVLDKLASWTEHPQPGVRFFSGVGTYTTRFTFTEEQRPSRSWALRLNDIQDVGMARVKVNGKDCGIAWTPPFEVDVTKALKQGENALEVEVANSWRNRLVGDRGLPAEQRITKTNIRIVPEWTLVPSGLLGPVQIVANDVN